jgi:hypothetical protein
LSPSTSENPSPSPSASVSPSPSTAPTTVVVYSSSQSPSRSVSPSPSASPSLPPELVVNPILYKNTIIASTVQTTSSTTKTFTNTIPSWNNLGRPESPKEGTVGFNIQNRSIEINIKNRWLRLPMRKISS